MTIIGAGQASFIVGQPEENTRIIQSLLDQATKRNVEILVLPELANSGYAFDSLEEAMACSETPPAGPVCRLLAEWSKPGRLVVSGLCERADVHLYNSAVVFAGGSLRACYRKVHLFAKEPDFFLPGSEEPPVIEFQGNKIGVMICFDWVFPEMARILALKGAHVILHPSNLVLPYCQQAMLVRSIENRVFTATANRFGLERGLSFSGNSQITSPKGDLLAKAGPDDVEVIAVDVDFSLADDKMMTSRNHLFNDRKPEVYRRLVDTVRREDQAL